MINLTDGSAVVGDQRLSWPWTYRVVNAVMHPRGGDPARPTKLDGRVAVPRRSVLFVQIT